MMSDDSVVIGGGSAELRLSEGGGLARAPGLAYFRATLRKTDLVGTHTQVSASTKIPAYGPQGELTRFFDAMAAAQEGERRWESVGAILTLSGTLYTPEESGRGGEARYLVEAVLKSALEDWWVRAGFSLGLGQLEDAAVEARRFFSAVAAP